MACNVNLFDLLGGSPNTNGTWAETTIIPPDYEAQGGVIGPGHLGAIDVDGIDPGSYTFEYTIGVPPCGDSTEITIDVVLVDAGTSFQFDLCSTENVNENMFTYLVAGSSNGTWSGTAVNSAGWSANASGPSDDTFNPSLVNPGTYIAVYTVDESAGSPCTNCVDSATLIINVVEPTLAGDDTNLYTCV